MIESIKNELKRRPRLYDIARGFVKPSSPVEQFLDQFSRSCDRSVSFIQIGANDGLRWDPVRRYVVRDGWRGILVEPLPAAFNLLRMNYRYLTNRRDLVFVNAAIGAEDSKTLSFWTYDEDYLQSLTLEDRMFLLRKASFSKDHVDRAIRSHSGSTANVKKVTVPLMTLSELVRDHWSHGEMDLLVMDTEGHESEIISSIDFQTMKPRAIVFESHNLSKPGKASVYGYLRDNGYSVRSFGGDDVATLETTQPS